MFSSFVASSSVEQQQAPESKQQQQQFSFVVSLVSVKHMRTLFEKCLLSPNPLDETTTTLNTNLTFVIYILYKMLGIDKSLDNMDSELNKFNFIRTNLINCFANQMNR